MIWDSETNVDEVYPAADVGSLSRPINFEKQLDGRVTVDRWFFRHAETSFSCHKSTFFVAAVIMLFLVSDVGMASWGVRPSRAGL